MTDKRVELARQITLGCRGSEAAKKMVAEQNLMIDEMVKDRYRKEAV